MRRLTALLIVVLSLVLGSGCSSEVTPKADPDFKSTTDPGDFTVPSQMQDLAPAGQSDPSPEASSSPAS